MRVCVYVFIYMHAHRDIFTHLHILSEEQKNTDIDSSTEIVGRVPY